MPAPFMSQLLWVAADEEPKTVLQGQMTAGLQFLGGFQKAHQEAQGVRRG